MVRPALPDNRITEDETFIYRYDVYGNLVEKRCHGNESEVHHFTWDSQHRLSQYSHTLSWSDGHDTTRAEYLYDAPGRRIGKRTVVLNSQGHPREEPRMTWYGWEGDNLVLTERDGQRIHTVYLPGSFVPLLRIEGDIPEPVQTLADTLTQDSGITFTPEVTQQLHQLEQELRDGKLSPHSQQWLAVSQLTPERLLPLLKPLPEPTTPVVHLYHCDHLGTPISLINTQGGIDWRAEFDPWGNQVDGSNPQRLYQPIRMQGQHYDDESGMHYNRHRYYEPALGRYISQDPIGLQGGWNPYSYPLDPLQKVDPLGLETQECIKPLHSLGGTGERSGPDIWGNPLYHKYLCVPDGKGGHICGGQDQRGENWYDGLWGPGKPSVDTLEGGGKCETIEPDNTCLEECLKGKFSGPRPRYTVLPDNLTTLKIGVLKNCQDWSDDIFNSCKNKCSGNTTGRFLNFIYKGVF